MGLLKNSLRKTKFGLKSMLISFEGVHGAGKTTLISSLRKYFHNKGRQIVIINGLDETTLGSKIQKINLNNKNKKMSTIIEALLIAAAHRQNIEEIIKPNINLGKVIFSERFSDAFIAFQRYGRCLPISKVLFLKKMVFENITPTLTILLDLNSDVALERITPQKRHRIENEPLHFHESVRRGYLKLAKQYPKRIKIIDASQSRSIVFQQTLDLLLTKFQSNECGTNAWI